jgi:hypothetical protein
MATDAVAKTGMFRGVMELDRASDFESVGEERPVNIGDRSMSPIWRPRSRKTPIWDPDLGNLERIRLKMRWEHASPELGVV